ncbi:ferrous iron transporter B [Enterobacter cloacae]|uniref:fimbrial protein n=1 Tax=Enterobacter TaxID=547 RepID=UPI00076F5AF6|nr:MULTISPECIES: fimbrial protein [Enterobacter]MCP1113590.1 fimbrial protein [Enterobacter bugandensis]HDR2621381.1 fimbrial protein [Enterobacter chuandaensis]AMJ71037.1 ferrous iron transporter B [Enterobacter cloacae]EJC0563696.1 fimbrial protein [Enterobacter cloacae]HBU6130270.1 fimbrial protein [Enterobacter cloacae]
MKKQLMMAMFAAGSVLTMTNTFAAAGTVNFNGNILDSACDVDVASQNQVVVLGDYNKTEFPAAGSRTAATRFDIVLKNCPVTVTNAKVRFDGTPDPTNANLLAIDSSVAGAATGVAINLMSADKVDLPLHGSNSYSYVLSSTMDNTLNFYAQYISTASAVTAGPANSVANFSVVYN